jgi:hypothetical protein
MKRSVEGADCGQSTLFNDLNPQDYLADALSGRAEGPPTAIGFPGRRRGPIADPRSSRSGTVRYRS